MHRVVGDRGFANETNRQYLRGAGGHVLFAEKLCRGGRRPGQAPPRYAIVADNLHVKEVWVGEGATRRRFIVCRNLAEAEPDKTRREQRNAAALRTSADGTRLVESIWGISIPFTIVYTQSVDDVYRFDERSYEALAANGIGWQTVLQVLRARPRVRQHIGAVLRVAAQAKDGRWIAVALIEEGDDEYLVVSARELDSEEVVAVTKMIEGDTE